MNNLFASAASLLLGEASQADAAQDAHFLLRELGYTPPAGAGLDREAQHRARLLKAASNFVRIFELAAPDAPSLVAFGAELDPATADAMHRGSPPVSVSGIGETIQEAFQGCVGEGVEYLSQLQHASDVVTLSGGSRPELAGHRSVRELMSLLPSFHPGRKLSWCPALRLSDRCEVLLPADLCLRRPSSSQDFVPPFPLSIGSAAGTSWEGAALHGLFELIERDAASLWWRGGRRGRAVPPDVEAIAQTMLAALREGAATPRRSWLLDITTDVGIPVVAALSCRPDGFGLAFGLAARRTLQAAVRSAVLEMCQIELALAVVEAKRRERGEVALNAKDVSHLQRATAIDADRCALLHPLPEHAEPVLLDGSDAGTVLSLAVRHLAELGIEVYSLDLTRPEFAIPVARIIAPGLQIEPSGVETPRLSHMVAQTGGGTVYTGGISLI